MRRVLNLLGFAACVALLGYAWYAQRVLGLEPCPLCIFQRVGVAATAVWAGKLSVAVGASTKAEMPCGAFVVALALDSFVASCADFSASEGGRCFSVGDGVLVCAT